MVETPMLNSRVALLSLVVVLTSAIFLYNLANTALALKMQGVRLNAVKLRFFIQILSLKCGLLH